MCTAGGRRVRAAHPLAVDRAHDLIGFVPQTAADAAYLNALWDAGFVFGFSRLVNDGDDGSSA